jgi:hypothetical protein
MNATGRAVAEALANSNGQGVYSDRTTENWAHLIDKRSNAIERLMNAAQHKEAFERNKCIERGWDPNRLPDLSIGGGNETLLRYAANHVLVRSQVEDSIQIRADKVVVLCAILSNPSASSHLDIELIMRVIDDVFSRYHDRPQSCLFGSLTIIGNRCNGLNMAAIRRAAAAAAAAAAGPVVSSSHEASMAAYAAYQAAKPNEGGFNKKNYRRSIKTSKSRKLRSRR